MLKRELIYKGLHYLCFMESSFICTEKRMESGKLKLLFAWIEIHKDELNANWTLLQDGQPFFKINPLV